MKARIMFAAGILGAMVSSSAFAQEQEGAVGDAAPRKLSAAAQVELLPMGTGKTTFEGESMSHDTATAYGITAMFDYAINPYLSVGVAPRLVLNVKASDAVAGQDAGKEVDLRARITGHFPVRPGLDVHAALMPGYTIVMVPEKDMDNPTGFAVAGALGATYDVTPGLFVGAEVGYQRAFTSQKQTIAGQTFSSDTDLSYLHVGLGAGARF
jgi:opacity protein-like surface antigen